MSKIHRYIKSAIRIVICISLCAGCSTSSEVTKISPLTVGLPMYPGGILCWGSKKPVIPPELKNNKNLQKDLKALDYDDAPDYDFAYDVSGVSGDKVFKFYQSALKSKGWTTDGKIKMIIKEWRMRDLTFHKMKTKDSLSVTLSERSPNNPFVQLSLYHAK